MVVIRHIQNPIVFLVLASFVGYQECPQMVAAAPPKSSDSVGLTDKIERLIRDLDDDAFETRELSERELIKSLSIGLDALREATRSPSPELRYRGTRALDQILNDRLLFDQALRWRAVRAYLKESNEADAVKALRRVFHEPVARRVTGTIAALEPSKRHFDVGDRIEFKAAGECDIPADLPIKDLTIRVTMISFSRTTGEIGCASRSFTGRSDPASIQSILVSNVETAKEGTHDVVFLLSMRKTLQSNYALLDTTSLTYTVMTPAINEIDRPALVLSINDARNVRHATGFMVRRVTAHDSDLRPSRALHVTVVDAHTIRIKAKTSGVTFLSLVDQNGQNDRVTVIVRRHPVPLHPQ